MSKQQTINDLESDLNDKLTNMYILARSLCKQLGATLTWQDRDKGFEQYKALDESVKQADILAEKINNWHKANPPEPKAYDHYTEAPSGPMPGPFGPITAKVESVGSLSVRTEYGTDNATAIGRDALRYRKIRMHGVFPALPGVQSAIFNDKVDSWVDSLT